VVVAGGKDLTPVLCPSVQASPSVLQVLLPFRQLLLLMRLMLLLMLLRMRPMRLMRFMRLPRSPPLRMRLVRLFT